MRELLLHALKLHLTVMQKPTETLCGFSLKFIDILTDTDEKRIINESRTLLKLVSVNIVDSIIGTIDNIEEKETSKTAVLSPALANTRKTLRKVKTEFESLDSESESYYTTNYTLLVAEIGRSMKIFGFCGLVKGITIFNINGDKLC
jgi:hypothetical protein